MDAYPTGKRRVCLYQKLALNLLEWAWSSKADRVSNGPFPFTFACRADLPAVPNEPPSCAQSDYKVRLKCKKSAFGRAGDVNSLGMQLLIKRLLRHGVVVVAIHVQALQACPLQRLQHGCFRKMPLAVKLGGDPWIC